MGSSEARVTTFSSIALILLRELRLERSIHQAQIADMCGKTPSAWTKIETGKTPLPMEMFFRVCMGLQVAPSAVLSTMERYATLFTSNNWAVVSKQLDFNEDTLLKEAQEYYGSSGFRARVPVQVWNLNTSVLNGPIYNPNGTVTPIDVFLFALNPEFKEQQINFQQIAMS